MDEDRRDRRDAAGGRERGDPARHERGGRRARNDGGWKAGGGRGMPVGPSTLDYHHAAGAAALDYHHAGRPDEGLPMGLPPPPQQQQVPDGSFLLSLLKANPPAATKYTREELFSIKHLQASHVKPSKLNPMIDRENITSPLVLKGKFDLEEDGIGVSRRDHHRDRRPREEMEDRRGLRKGMDGMNGTVGLGGSVPSAAAPSALQGTNGRNGGGRGRDMHGWGPADHAAADARLPRPARNPKMDTPEWDMPDPNVQCTMNLSDYTLGDIRQAEGSAGGGAGGGGGSGGGGFFVDESDDEEDVTQASRAFGKWFNKAPTPSGGAAEAADTFSMAGNSRGASSAAAAPASAAPAAAAAAVPAAQPSAAAAPATHPGAAYPGQWPSQSPSSTAASAPSVVASTAAAAAAAHAAVAPAAPSAGVGIAGGAGGTPTGQRALYSTQQALPARSWLDNPSAAEAEAEAPPLPAAPPAVRAPPPPPP
mmetsp:Transcript_70129/g.168101  ORF Transcript_70129/g.168101 Transcript_70129/m.168101 type:complete len:479 (-) Transcript_70129:100-1536(-)